MKKEDVWLWAASLGGTLVNVGLGGWDKPLNLLVYLMVADYASGIVASVRSGKGINSEVMFWGGVRKAFILGVIYMTVLLDGVLHNEDPVFRNLAIYFYVGREGLSVIENLGILGVWLPSWLKGILEQIKDRGEKKP